jgi:hypothetical protein
MGFFNIAIVIGRHGEVRHALLDIATVTRDLASQPTHVNELVQGSLDYASCCDASAWGVDGVWFGGNEELPPIVWCQQWPQDITEGVVLTTDPNGHLTNSNLEMARVVLQETVLEATLGPKGMQGAQTAIGCDNSPAVAWTTRMASRSASPISFRLLRGLAMRQRITKSAPPALFHVTGVQNTLADVASRPIKGITVPFHVEDSPPNSVCPSEFLTFFDSHYALPQKRPWSNVLPPSDLWSNVISTLRGQRLPLRQWRTTTHDQRPGPTGAPMPKNATLIHGCGSTTSHLNKSTSLPLPHGFELESSGMRSRLATSWWKRPCVT